MAVGIWVLASGLIATYLGVIYIKKDTNNLCYSMGC